MRFIAKILVLSVFTAATFAYAQTLPSFQHIIVIVQENRTPDNLFGSNIAFEPGVDLQQPNSGQWCLGACFDPGHMHADWENEYNNVGSCPGRGNAGPCTAKTTYCNNAVVALGQASGKLALPICPQRSYVSGTYDNSIVAPYFDIATKYGFANYFFQTNQGPSMPAHEFLFTGTSAPTGIAPIEGHLNFFQAENPLNQNDTNDTGCTADAGETVPLIDQYGVETNGSQYNVYPCFYHNSLPTLLDAANPRVTWKYYTNETSQTATNGIWNAPAAIGSICLPTSQYDGKCNGTDYVNNVVVNNPAQVLLDLGLGSLHQCALRNVSWVIPNYDRSDHPGFDPNQDHSNETEAGPAWVADIITVWARPCVRTKSAARMRPIGRTPPFSWSGMIGAGSGTM